MDEKLLPYRAEYAKSGRAACKSCKNTIEKDSLRLAVMVQSPFFDGKQPNWHHYHCFFAKFRPKDTDEIAYYQSLRWEDQEKIKKSIESIANGSVQVSNNGKGKRKNSSVNVPNLQDYTIGYAKSGKSICRLCEEFISKNEVRVSKKDYESERALQYGPLERWHHVDCFVKVRDELQFYASGNNLPGFKTLSPEDQKMIKSKIPQGKQPDDVDGPSPSKKMKESLPDNVKEDMKKQNKILFKYRDQLEELKKTELTHLLEYNDQIVPEGTANILDRLADAMAFGTLKKCSKCNGQFVFQSGIGYKCTGNISEWARCENKEAKPQRVAFKIPDELRENYKFLDKYKCKVTARLFVESAPKEEKEVKETAKAEKIEKSGSLHNIRFLIHKSNGSSPDDLKSKIKDLGGKTVTKFSDDISAVVSTEDELNKKKLVKVISSSKDCDIPVLSAAFFEGISNATSRDDLIRRFMENKISMWGSNAEKFIPETNAIVEKKSAYPKKSQMFKSQESVKKVTLKDGLVVDPDSNLDKVAHVYRNGRDVYSTVLSLADVQTNRNSYYKLQILEGDEKKKYWLFRSWGRIGTTIGGSKVEKFSSVSDCIDSFKELFEEKTGNVWELRDKFEKIPKKMMMLEVNYKEEKNDELIRPIQEISSLSLHKAVQELISLIFDIEAMRKTMLEFELDLVKMPLGKISQAQIQNAFSILTELQDLVKTPDNSSVITDRTNRFYTLIPHDCGVNNPPLLNNDDVIKQKIEVLHNLMEIEIAFKLLQECQESGNTIDEHYAKLNTEIIVLDRDSEEFKFIQIYVTNTHAKTHMNYGLEIEEIFKIERKGEAKRFKKFRKLPNRKLLWHGSRVTNFAGILSQGLRIAPPEAPVTGYMFGKGIYFADRVSKSANYCMTSKQNPTGLMLLCEVALGEMYELTSAKCIQKLPSGKHSVKGMGKTVPDPKEIAYSPTGAEVPLGPCVQADVKKSSLLYNEYIVYDVSQVKIQYLVRLKFDHKV